MSEKQAKKLRKLLKREVESKYKPQLEQEMKRRMEEAKNSRVYSGLRPEKPHRKDYVREKALGAVEAKYNFGDRLKQIRESGILSNIIFQGSDNSCVSCSFTWANMYNSWFKSQNRANLNWRYLWSIVPKEAGGSKPRDNGDALRSVGESEVGLNNPEKYKIKNYLYLYPKNYEAVKSALTTTPVIIGFYADQAGLTPNHFAHAVVCVDLNEQGDYVCINWWKADAQDIITVPRTVGLVTALTLEDLPDGLDTSKIRLGVLGSIRHFL